VALDVSKELLRSVLQLLITVIVVPSSLILFTVMMEAVSSYETSVLTRVRGRNIQQDSILHSHRLQNLKSYKDHYKSDILTASEKYSYILHANFQIRSKMPSSGMSGSVALVRTDVSKEGNSSFTRVERISEIGIKKILATN
jgi:hypothetical protein